MLIGFLFCALGTNLSLKANLGLSPWDVFHQGLSNTTGLTFGQASIITSLLIIAINLLMKLEIGIGTILNMTLIGIFIDIMNLISFLPDTDNMFIRICMLILSLFSSSFGTYLYIGCELGCGPRDGLMVILIKLTKKPLYLIRCSIELSVLIIGTILGGKIGISTLIFAIGISYCTQFIFKVFNCDINKLNHKSIRDTLNLFNKEKRYGI